MTWWAIKGPDGEWRACAPGEEAAWLRAGFAHLGTRREAVKMGYRCVEVQLVEPGTADKLAKIIEWAKENVPDKCTCSPEYYNRGRQDPSCLWCDFEAEQLWEIIGVESTSPTGGEESKEDGK